mmetsp:Transcript_145216/g.404715  ORF Transcript_145216/g.404715 Transcript_145216/m.404715 type:complete len:297 (-) Transcript_145216:88-978(-)
MSTANRAFSKANCSASRGCSAPASAASSSSPYFDLSALALWLQKTGVHFEPRLWKSRELHDGVLGNLATGVGVAACDVPSARCSSSKACGTSYSQTTRAFPVPLPGPTGAPARLEEAGLHPWWPATGVVASSVLTTCRATVMPSAGRWSSTTASGPSARNPSSSDAEASGSVPSSSCPPSSSPSISATLASASPAKLKAGESRGTAPARARADRAAGRTAALRRAAGALSSLNEAANKHALVAAVTPRRAHCPKPQLRLGFWPSGQVMSKPQVSGSSQGCTSSGRGLPSTSSHAAT